MTDTASEEQNLRLIDLVLELVRTEAANTTTPAAADAGDGSEVADWVDSAHAAATTPEQRRDAATQAGISARLEQVLRAVTAHLIVEAEQYGTSKAVLSEVTGHHSPAGMAAAYPSLVAFRRARIAADVTGLTIPVEASGITFNIEPATPPVGDGSDT